MSALLIERRRGGRFWTESPVPSLPPTMPSVASVAPCVISHLGAPKHFQHLSFLKDVDRLCFPQITPPFSRDRDFKVSNTCFGSGSIALTFSRSQSALHCITFRLQGTDLEAKCCHLRSMCQLHFLRIQPHGISLAFSDAQLFLQSLAFSLRSTDLKSEQESSRGNAATCCMAAPHVHWATLR